MLPPLTFASLSVSLLLSLSPNYCPILLHHPHSPCCCDKDINNDPPWLSSEDEDEDKIVVSMMPPHPCRCCTKRAVLRCCPLHCSSPPTPPSFAALNPSFSYSSHIASAAAWQSTFHQILDFRSLGHARSPPPLAL